MLIINDVSKTLFEEIGLRPGFFPTPEGQGFSVLPEGDIGAGLAAYVLKEFSGKPVVMVEPFFVDKSDGSLVVGHGGPNDYTDPNGGTIISRDIRFAKTSYRYAGAPFAWHVLSPGEKQFFIHLRQMEILNLLQLWWTLYPKNMR